MRRPSIAVLLLAPLVGLASAALPLGVSAQTAQETAAVDRSLVDPSVVARAVASLNASRTMVARFVQRGQNGAVWTGRMWVSRPGKLRFQYDPPEDDVIWSSGGLVKHYDAELDSVSHVPPDMTPAWFLLDDEVRITDDVHLLATAERGDRFFVTATQSGAFTDGRVTLAFEGSPARLLGWTTTDVDGSLTQVDLVDLVVGQDIPEKVFDYKPPSPEFPAGRSDR